MRVWVSRLGSGTSFAQRSNLHGVDSGLRNEFLTPRSFWRLLQQEPRNDWKIEATISINKFKLLSILPTTAPSIILPCATTNTAKTVTAGVPVYVFALVLSSVCSITGLMWDISWHRSIGRDSFFTPPHVLVYAGALLGGLFPGIRVLYYSFAAPAAARKGFIKFWGIFYGSLGELICIWGALAMLTSAPFDDWWHSAYGLDITLLSPPHALLGTGISCMQFGACISICKYLNGATQAEHQPSIQSKYKAIFRVLFVIATACFLTGLAIWADDYIGMRLQHTGFFYQLTAFIFLLFLPAFARQLRLKYGMTIITFAYFLFAAATNWLLQLVPATPMLGPIFTHIDHLQALQFPLLLFIQAFIIDLLLPMIKGNDWIKAAAISFIFVLLLVIVQYPFSSFLVTSPAARNLFFGSHSWYYSLPPDVEFRYQFMPENDTPVAGLFPAISTAIVLGFFAARLSLRWGKWMQQIER